MKTTKLGAAAVLVSSLFGGAVANAAPLHGATSAPPTYSAPADVEPTYRAPTYVPPHEARPVRNDGDDDRWQRQAWERFEQGARNRESSESAFLARERANFVERFGWNGYRMAEFDRHQAQERASFNQAEAQRRSAFESQLAVAAREHRHGRGVVYEMD